MKRVQCKKYKIRTYKINKISLFLMIKYLFQMMVFIHVLIFIKTKKKQIFTDDHKLEKNLTNKKGSKGFSQMIKDSHN